MPKLKTYSHLLKHKRKPTEYEIVCSDLLYYPKRGFEVNTPLQKWYDQYQRNSSLKCSDWELFTDPRETTYTKYTALQKQKETFVDGILESIEGTHYDRKLSKSWLEVLDRILTPLRFLWHGLQMVSCYVGQMAPSGRIVVASMFQAADEMRRIQRVAYRMRQIQLTHPDFGKESQHIWEKDPIWQPLRKVVERLLITYDWGEAIVVLNLVVKPLLDQLFMIYMGKISRNENDFLLGEILFSLNEDCLWHRSWMSAFTKVILKDVPENNQTIERWLDTWYFEVFQAITPVTLVLENESSDGSIASLLDKDYKAFLSSVGLDSLFRYSS